MPPTSWYRAAALLFAAAAFARPAAAQDFPTRPITMIVAFSAGGYADSFARIVGARLGERLGQNVVIENHGGGGGNIAGANVAHAPPDGYTLLVTTSSVAVNETYYKKKLFAAADLKAVAIPAGAPETLSVKPTDPAKTLADVVQAGRAKPFDYASAGVGTASHVAAAYFFKVLAKIDPVHVPFQGGAPAVNAVLGGHVQVLVGTLPGYAAQFRSGTIRGIAVASPHRLAKSAFVKGDCCGERFGCNCQDGGSHAKNFHWRPPERETRSSLYVFAYLIDSVSMSMGGIREKMALT